MDNEAIIAWLLEGDVSIQYQTRRDLLGDDDRSLQRRIAEEGWGARFLSFRHENGHWGSAFYQPKWTSTHYTLLDIKNLNMSPDNEPVRQTVSMIVEDLKTPDGGILPVGSTKKSDMCINGMVLNYACYFGADEKKLESVVDCLLENHMPDGGFNCQLNRKGAVHSSLHTTISVIEGIREYIRNGYAYRLAEMESAERKSQEFILIHRLFRSHRTGEAISDQFLRLSYPSRWRYDILRALDYFRLAGVRYDARMVDALQVLLKKCRKDNTWPLQARHAGQTHFEMEATGGPSRWNTLRAMRVLKFYNDV